MSESEEMIGMYNKQNLLNGIFKAEVIISPITFQPIINVTGELTMELLQDLGSHLSTEELHQFLGECLSHAIINKSFCSDVDVQNMKDNGDGSG